MNLPGCGTLPSGRKIGNVTAGKLITEIGCLADVDGRTRPPAIQLTGTPRDSSRSGDRTRDAGRPPHEAIAESGRFLEPLLEQRYHQMGVSPKGLRLAYANRRAAQGPSLSFWIRSLSIRSRLHRRPERKLMMPLP